ncbi:cytochrome c biogenesis protein CcdA [Leptolyngbya sp. FACHB-261]|uniref:cytochrome c biogenesis protein CcdA n=1 Tax=Leptolyngbya sp. FACHB-261 TaxID=2692806 RepID=UPI001689AAE9|nr:cytochrome c biogenesis protein CcdA [Leptolyngbya sp. FACHB-261]MBD2101199.1 sulfite exporter TauE/SafE family protein [Leptolyngbya sp. FACHB-261]
MLDTLDLWLYRLSEFSDRLVADQLTHLSLLSLGIVFGAGLLTSLTPCMLSMLPIAVSYIGGYETPNRWQAALQSLWFALGLATTLTALGLAVAWLGGIYGQVGAGWGFLVGTVAILMGLNLLEVLPLRLPSLGQEIEISEKLPRGLRSYLVGLTFGTVASPCSTPVLITLLAWVSSTGNPVVGAGLLLAYAVGYVSPLVVAGTFTAAIKKFLEVRRWSGWLTWASGLVLISFGTLSILSRLA